MFIGVRTVPHVIRYGDELSEVLLPLDPNLPHSEDHVQEEDELVAHVSHDKNVLKYYNTKVCYYLEKATRSTQHVISIKSYQRNIMVGILGYI